MRLTRIVISVLLAGMLSIPALASSDWVDDFLHRYDPKPESSPSQPANAAVDNALAVHALRRTQQESRK